MRLTDLIKRSVRTNYTFMEVCGGHTASIRRFGIPSLLPDEIKLISGPGCPVCVTGTDFIDKVIEYSRDNNTIITAFGDLLRIPGSVESLEKMKARGADVRVVFSGLDALETARLNPGKKVIFPAVGFETTAPGTAVSVKKAVEDKINNFFIISSHKIMPPVMESVLKQGTNINGFICPGHVQQYRISIFSCIPRKYNIGCVITGFETADILMSRLMLIRQVYFNEPRVEISTNGL